MRTGASGYAREPCADCAADRTADQRTEERQTRAYRRAVLKPGITPENIGAPIEALKQCVAYAKTKNVYVTIENRGERDPSILARMMRESGARANPDIGNFPDEPTRERGMKELLPLTSNNCHVKMRPGSYDMTKYIQMTKDFGFKGTYSIESGRNLNPDPLVAVQIVLDQLLVDL